MSRSLNKAMLIGNLGNDPEIRSTTGGNRVASFSLATSRSWSGANGERQDKTEWHRCVVWNRRGASGTGLVEVIEKYVRKGDRLYVEGQIEYRQWQDKEGQTRYTTEINVRDLVMLGGNRGGDGEDSAPRARATAGARAGAAGAASDDFEEFPAALEDSDDDLPF